MLQVVALYTAKLEWGSVKIFYFIPSIRMVICIKDYKGELSDRVFDL
jgi:hypothetical protein